MAIIQISKIQVRSGDLVDLPQLDEAEFGFANDEKRLFIGKTTPNENVEILTAYSSLGFSQIAGANGANLSLSNFEDGQVLAINDVGGNLFVTNRGGSKGGEINLGAVGNITITGGSSGQVLTTDGTGNLSWSAGGGSGGSPGGNSTEVQFNSSGSFAGDAGFTYSSGTLSVPTNVNTLNVSANALALLYANGLITGAAISSAGDLYAAANANVDINLRVTGNANVGNLGTAGLIVATGNVTGGNIRTAGQLVSTVATGTAPLSVASTTLVPNLHAESADTATTAGTATTATSATTAGTVTTAAQPNITSVGTLSSLSVTATVTAGNLSTGGNLSVTGGFANITGNVNLNGANITLSGGNGFIYTMGDITASNIGTGLAVMYSNGLITSTGLSIKASGGPTANIVLYGNGDATIKGTSIFEGNLNVQQKSNLGPASNVIITGGTNGYFLQTDGAGNLSWAVAGGGGSTVPGGSNTQIQFNDAGSFGGNNSFTFNKISGNVQIPGNVDIGENLILGNSSAAGVSINLRDASGSSSDTAIFYTTTTLERIGVILNSVELLTLSGSYNQLTGNLIINSGNLGFTTTGTLLFANANITTANAFGSAGNINIGSASSNTTLRGNLILNTSITFTNDPTIVITTTSSPRSILMNVNGTKLAVFESNTTVYGELLAVGNGIGYGSGSGGTVIQTGSRNTGVTINKATGSITLVSAAGSASWNSFAVTNSTVAATDTIVVNQKSGSDQYQIFVTNIVAGSFTLTFATTGGTTIEQPVFNFSVIKGVTA